MKDENIFKLNYNLLMKKAMIESGVTTRKLAEKTGYSYEGVRQIIKGNGSYWGVFKLCRALGVDIKMLITDELDLAVK